MVENGNKAKGVILTILLGILLLVTISEIILLNTTHQLAAIGYNDPSVSTNHVRGTIYDRNGKILAIQAPEYGFTITSNDNHQLIAAILAEYSNYSSFEISVLLDNGVTFIPVKGIPTSSDVDYYQKFLEINGLEGMISFTTAEKRKYPAGVLLDILGTATSPYAAEGGIEELFNEVLSARPTLNMNSVYGKALVLTIDQDLQLALEQSLREYPDLTSVLVFSQNKEILAALGTMDEGTLRTMVYSISSDEETVLNQHPLEDDIWENTTTLGSYLVYVDAKNKEAVMNNLHLSFSRNGKI